MKKSDAAASAVVAVDGLQLPYLLLLARWRKAAAAACELKKPTIACPVRAFSLDFASECPSDESLPQMHSAFSQGCDFFRCPTLHNISEQADDNPIASQQGPVSTIKDAAELTDSPDQNVATTEDRPAIEAPRALAQRTLSACGWGKKLLDSDHEDDDLALLLPNHQATSAHPPTQPRPAKRPRDGNEETAPSHQVPAPASSKPYNSYNSPLAILLTEAVRRFYAAFPSAMDDDVLDEREIEARRTKDLPGLVMDSIKYVKDVAAIHERSAPSSPVLPWTIKYPPPQFRNSVFVKELNRIKKWLLTWRIAGGIQSDCSGLDEAADSDAGNCSSSGSPLAGSSDSFSEAFIFDDRGNRASARIARKEALKRAEEEEEERRRQKQKGYFSNDKSAIGSTSTEGGEGSLSNIAVIAGPCGIGKTTVAFTAAAAMGYRVVEINTSVKRCPKAVERIFSEATQSKQIRINAQSTAVHDQLSKWKAESDARKEADLRIQAELEKRRQKEEAKAPTAAPAVIDLVGNSKAKAKVPGKKSNAISKEAVSKFFAPKPKPAVAIATSGSGSKSPAPSSEVHVDVDAECAGGRSDKCPSTAVQFDVADDDDDDVVEVQLTKRSKDTRKKTSVAPDLVHAAAVAPPLSDAAQPPQAASGPPPLLPLILVESADVILPDEQARPFYNSIRRLAAESKFPIVVTANSMTLQQACSFFGQGTPHAEMSTPSSIVISLELMLIIAVENKYIVIDKDTMEPQISPGAETVMVDLGKQIVEFMWKCASPLEARRHLFDARACLLDAQLHFQNWTSVDHHVPALAAVVDVERAKGNLSTTKFGGSPIVVALSQRLAAAEGSVAFNQTPIPQNLCDSSDDSENESDSGLPDQLSVSANNAVDELSARGSPHVKRARLELFDSLTKRFSIPHRFKGQFARLRAVTSSSALLDFVASPWVKRSSSMHRTEGVNAAVHEASAE